MKSWMRGLAAIMLVACTLAVLLPSAFAQSPSALVSERDRNSYMVGMDVGRSIAPVGPDMAPATFERAVRNAFDGGKPLLSESEAKSLAQSLMQRAQARVAVAGASAPGATRPTGALPSIDKEKVGLLVGSDVGRSLAPIKDELDVAVFMRGVT
ncbi:MAG: FKBP-type peptidyl-prolyl cis-trans isomerase N-terminal domain-containing protein, partial [Pseudomonadota bacterium]|nr:FKBP-type peptidyl-prolyl cis-trans isomerase N-terminal domain-containing protein [Pseudomonadota bacterium]